MTVILTILAAAAVTVVGVLTAFLVGMRQKVPAVLDTVRAVNQRVFNPRQLRSAGTPGAYAGIVHHTGRTSGRHYETPIGPTPTEDGFIIGLPYGTRADWVRNVLAAGSATIVHEGASHRVDHPQLVDREAALPYYSASDQRTQRLFGIEQFLRVRTAPPEA